MFIQIDTLPRSQSQSTLRNRYIETDTHQAALDVSGHVIVTFQSMLECPVSIPLRGNQLVERRFHVGANIWIGILVNRQTGGSMLNKEIAHANVDLL